jgi:hypothetical protein
MPSARSRATEEQLEKGLKPLEMETKLNRTTLIRLSMVAALAVGCRSGKTVVSAEAAGTQGQSQPVAYQPQPRAAGAVGDTARWVTVRDQREEAFSIDVPLGWNATGGMFRYRIAYPRPSIDMNSPDGRINLRIGDSTIPNYQTPNPNPYLPVTPGGPPVARYASGDVFAGKYGLARFGSMCQGIELKGTRPAQPKYSRADSAYTQSTAGVANFTCVRNGVQMSGYVYAETMLVRAVWGQPSNWYVMALGSYLAPAAQEQTAAALLKHSAESIVMSPEWLETQAGLVGSATRINLGTADANAAATREMNARQEKWKKMMAGETDNFNDILNGRTFTLDPSTGKTWDVPTGTGGQKWMDNQQNVVSSAMQPGPSFHALETISH